MIGARPERALIVLVVALASAPAGAGAAPKPVALSAAPARVMLTGSARTVLRVTNSGTKGVFVDASRAAFALSLRGRPRIVRAGGARSAAAWLKLQPTRFALPARTSASVVVSSTVPRNAEPGDHDALVLLTTRPRAGARVAVRIRLGVRLIVRAPGTVVRRLNLRGLRAVRRRVKQVLELGVSNRGNVTEAIPGVRVTVSRNSRRLATLVAARREVRPHTRAIVEFRLRRRMRGAVTARVVVPAVPGRKAIRRTYRLRL